MIATIHSARLQLASTHLHPAQNWNYLAKMRRLDVIRDAYVA